MELVIISGGYDLASLGGAWFYMPRMLQPKSRVYLESLTGEGEPSFRLLPAAEIELLASGCRKRRAA